MPMSHSMVHPLDTILEDVEGEQQQEQAAFEVEGNGVLMHGLPGVPGTPGALGLRVAQIVFSLICLAVMASTADFAIVAGFCFLVAAASLQGVWSLILACVDIYALIVKRGLRKRQVVRVAALGDLITGGVTFGAASAAAGMTVFLDNDMGVCQKNPCASYKSGVAMAFMCWFCIAPTCLVNLMLLF